MKILFLLLIPLTISTFFVLVDAQSGTSIEANLDKNSYTVNEKIIVTGKIIGFDKEIHSEIPIFLQHWYGKGLGGIVQVFPNSDGTFSISYKAKGDVNTKHQLRLSFDKSPVFETEFNIVEGLKIIEIESNPAGSDIGKEWVRLFNPLSESVDLSGMFLTSIHGDTNSHPLSGSIGPCQELMVLLPGQFLDNEFDTVSIMLGAFNTVYSVDVSDDENDNSTWKAEPPKCEGGLEYVQTETKSYSPSVELETISSDKSTKKIPEWVKNTMGWYAEGLISEDEIISAIKYLIQERIIKLD